jgi:NADH pyrophosphatase NudC (nudix superfamily)
MPNFFEKIAKKIDKGAKVVTSVSKEFIEITKLKNEIKRTEELIQKQFTVIGQRVFDMFNKESFNLDELRDECIKVKTLFRRITELEEEIRRVKKETLARMDGEDIIICPACGKVNKSGNKFCSSCGKNIQGETMQNKLKCPKCNFLLEEGAKFCSRCGQKIG